MDGTHRGGEALAARPLGRHWRRATIYHARGPERGRRLSRSLAAGPTRLTAPVERVGLARRSPPVIDRPGFLRTIRRCTLAVALPLALFDGADLRAQTPADVADELLAAD